MVNGARIAEFVSSRELRLINQRQVAAFLRSEDGSDFEPDTPADFPVELEDGYILRLSPARYGTDGFFGAVLRRREGGWSRARRSL